MALITSKHVRKRHVAHVASYFLLHAKNGRLVLPILTACTHCTPACGTAATAAAGARGGAPRARSRKIFALDLSSRSPVPGYGVAVLDEDGRELPRGELGLGN